jgi:hypothetical protein
VTSTLVHSHLTKPLLEEDSAHVFDTLLLSSGGLGANMLQSGKRKKKLKKKASADILVEKGIDVKMSSAKVLSGTVKLGEFGRFLLWFPLLGSKGDRTILRDVVSIMGHR